MNQNDNSDSAVSLHLFKASLVSLARLVIVMIFLTMTSSLGLLYALSRYSNCPLGVTPRTAETTATE
jgi:hypothetical protein